MISMSLIYSPYQPSYTDLPCVPLWACTLAQSTQRSWGVFPALYICVPLIGSVSKTGKLDGEKGWLRKVNTPTNDLCEGHPVKLSVSFGGIKQPYLSWDTGNTHNSESLWILARGQLQLHLTPVVGSLWIVSFSYIWALDELIGH